MAQVVRVPLYGTLTGRTSSTSKDQLFKNCFPEKLVRANLNDSLSKNDNYYTVVKRPGLSTTYTHTAGEGRGIYEWQGSLYYAIGNTLYKDGTSIGTIVNTTGKVYFTEIQGGTPRLIIKDIDALFHVTTGDTVEQVNASLSVTSITHVTTTATATVTAHPYNDRDTVTIAGASPTDYNGAFVITNITANTFDYTMTADPGANATGTITAQRAAGMLSNLSPGVANIDGYLVLATENLASSGGTVQTSNVNNPDRWGASATLTPAELPDKNLHVLKYLNYIVVFGADSIEFFYDAGNATGSILSPVDGSVLTLGLAAKHSPVQFANKMFFIARDSFGGRKLVLLDGFKVNIVSNPVAERLINGESDPNAIITYGIRHSGHSFYMMNLPDQAKTLVYDMELDEFHIWTYYNGTTESVFNCNDMADLNGTIYCIGRSDGKVYKLDTSIYQDGGNDIKVQVVNDQIDFGVDVNKFLHRLELVADIESVSATVNISWTDDDYATFSSTRNIFDTKRMLISRLGMFKRRAFKIDFVANSALRLFYLDLAVTASRNLYQGQGA